MKYKMGNYLLNVGRAMGLDNLNQFQLLRKTAMSDNAGKFVGRFNFKAGGMDTFVALDKSEAKEYNAMAALFKRLFPKSTSGKSETIVDVIFQKFNRGKITEGSSTLSLNSVTRNGREVIGSSDVKVINNTAGTIVDMSGKGESGSNYSLHMHISKLKNDAPLAQEVINALNYSELGNMGNLTAQISNKGAIKNFEARAELPAEYFDTLARLTSEGSYPKFSEALEATKMQFSDTKISSGQVLPKFPF